MSDPTRRDAMMQAKRDEQIAQAKARIDAANACMEAIKSKQ